MLLATCNAQAQTTGNYANVPAGKAYAEGKEIYFTHTEASDKAIAEKLTNMMKSPVIYVPAPDHSGQVGGWSQSLRVKIGS